MFKINNLLSCIIFYNVYIRIISSLVEQMTDNLRTGTYYGKERKSLPSRYITIQQGGFMEIDHKTTAVGFAKQTAETMQKMADAIQVLSNKIIENHKAIVELENKIALMRNTTDHDFISVESRIDELEEKSPTLFDK